MTAGVLTSVTKRLAILRSSALANDPRVRFQRGAFERVKARSSSRSSARRARGVCADGMAKGHAKRPRVRHPSLYRQIPEGPQKLAPTAASPADGSVPG